VVVPFLACPRFGSKVRCLWVREVRGSGLGEWCWIGDALSAGGAAGQPGSWGVRIAQGHEFPVPLLVVGAFLVSSPRQKHQGARGFGGGGGADCLVMVTV